VMSNRASRRAAISDFRRVAQSELVTYLVEADLDLSEHPQLLSAQARWQFDIERRRPSCIGCKASFAGSATPAAYLFATANTSRMTSVSVFCQSCWANLPDSELERVALRVLRKVLPGARFAP
jgi:hypothetical protein